MNKIHKSQYNESLGTWVAVPEIAKGRGKSATVAKDVLSASPSLPKFAVSALTFALLQVVSVSAYAAIPVNKNIAIATCNASSKDAFFVCGSDVYTNPVNKDEYKNAASFVAGSNVYANMSTAIGNSITIGSESAKTKYKDAIQAAKIEATTKGEDDFTKYINEKELYSEIGEGSVAVGSHINIETKNTVAIGNNISSNSKNSVDNSIFLGNDSGYISNKKKTLGNAVGSSVSLDDVKLSKDLNYAGVNNTIGVVSVGNSKQTRRIQGVAPGLVSENSADAINGAQLHAAYEKIGTNETNITKNIENITKNKKDIDELSQGWKINKANTNDIKSYAEMTEATAIKSGNTVNFVGSDTLTVALKKDENNNVAVKFDIDQDKLHTDSLARLPVVYTDGDGNIVQRFGEEKKWYKISDINNANGDYSNLDGIDDNQIVASVHNPNNPNSKDFRGEKFKLTNLREGDVRDGSTDAINGSQLYASNQRIGKNETDIEYLGQGWNINKISAKEIDSYADMTDATAIKAGSTVNFADSDTVSVELKRNKDSDKIVAVQFKVDQNVIQKNSLDQLPVVYTDEAGNIVQRVGDKWYQTSEIARVKGDYTKLRGGIDGNEILAASLHNPVADEGARGKPFKLTNLDKGSVSAESKDAINGTQLFADRVALAGFLGGGAAAIDSNGKGFTLDDEGKKVTAKNSLDRLILDGDFQKPKFTVNKANGDVFQIGTGSNAKDAEAHNVGDALDNLNKYVNEGITVTGSNGRSDQLTPTETLEFANGEKTKTKVEKVGNTVMVTVDVDSNAITNDVLTQSPIIYTVKKGEKNVPVVKVEGKWYLAKDVKNSKPVSGAEEQSPGAINASLRNPENATEETAGKHYILNNIADAKDDFDAINKRQFDYAVVYSKETDHPKYDLIELGNNQVQPVLPFKTADGKGPKDSDPKTTGGTAIHNLASAGDIRKDENAGHAVNAADLRYQVDSLTKKGLTFADNKGGSVHKELGETLTVSGGKNITVVSSNNGLEISTIDSPIFGGKVTAEGGIIAGKSNPIAINTKDNGRIDGLKNIDIEKNGKSLLDDGKKGTAATEAQLRKVIAKIDGKIGDKDKRVTEGRVFSGDIGGEVKVGLGESLAVTGGIKDKTQLTDNNIGVVADDKGKELSIKLGKNLKGIHSVSLTADSQSTGGKGNNGGSDKTPKTDLDNDGIKIQPASGAKVTLTSTGLNNGGKKIKEVAAGEIGAESTDAINGGQLQDQIDAVKRIIGGNVKYDKKSNIYVAENPNRDGNGNITGGIGGTGKDTIDAAIKSIKVQKTTPYKPGDNITFSKPDQDGRIAINTDDKVKFTSIEIYEEGDSSKTPVITINNDGINAGDKRVVHVADGRVSPDSTDAVNGRQLYNVRRDINEMDKRASSGIASAMASAGLPQAYLPGKSMVGAAASNYRGEMAIAVGVSTISDNGKWLVKADANANRKDFGVSLGVGYQW